MRSVAFPAGLIALSLACRGPGDIAINEYNGDPTAVIHAPADGAEFTYGSPVEFVGLVNDDNGVPGLAISWVSSIDGILVENDVADEAGNVALTIADLSPGPHVVTLSAVDPRGNFGEDTVTVNIIQIPEAPSIYIDRPTGGEKGAEGYPFRFSATVDDAQDDPRDLHVVLSEDNGDGTYDQICSMNPDSAGVTWCDATLLYGSHSLVFEVTDSDANSSSASTIFEVISALDHDGDGDGWTENQGDCNDDNGLIYPGATEICDGLDGDCNVATPIDKGTECFDDDGDGYTEVDGDCDDAVGSGIMRTPGKAETPDHIDNDCDGIVDEGTVFYDDDFDGYCEQPPCENTGNMQRDCNDAAITVNPAAPEVCDNGLDNNCDGTADPPNTMGCTTFYKDVDGDGFGASGSGSSACLCKADSTYRANNQNDCYDNNAQAKPGATAFHNNSRGDGSYDWNCDGNQEKQYRQTAGPCSEDFSIFGILFCSINGGGWSFGEPACGTSGFWATDCDAALNLSCAACAFAADPAQCLSVCGGGGGTNCAPQGNSMIQACR